MKTRTMYAVALAITLVCVFSLSGFSQAADPPDKGKTSGEEQLITLTKKYYSKKNCIDLNSESHARQGRLVVASRFAQS